MVYRIFDAVTQLGSANAPFVRQTKDEFERDRSPKISENRQENHAYVKIPKIKVLTRKFSSKYNHSKVFEKNPNESK
jgi:hypothetical protein